nr:hypothetical protein [Saprospiraceae bacterium]
MNKFLLLLFFISIGVFACTNSEGESSDSNVTVTEEERPTRENREHNSLVRETWTVNEVLDLWINNLNERLSLSEQAQEEIRIVYQNAYLEQGVSLDDQLSRGEVRKISRDLMQNTQNEIKEILTPDQFKFYKGHIDR